MIRKSKQEWIDSENENREEFLNDVAKIAKTRKYVVFTAYTSGNVAGNYL